jgi:hypothetical protein
MSWLRPFRIERARIRKSFLLLFFKKEDPFSLSHFTHLENRIAAIKPLRQVKEGRTSFLKKEAKNFYEMELALSGKAAAQ